MARGEKYDSCYDDEPLYFGGPRTQLRRVSNPVGPGFPADDFNQMLGGGAAGLERVARYSGRASDTISRVADQATQTLGQAGADPAARLAAGQQVVTQLQSGFADVQQQVAQSNVTLQMLDDAGTFQPGELESVARDSARSIKQVVGEHVGPLDDLISRVLTSAQDWALNAVGDQAEALVSRMGEFAHANATRLYNGLLRRGTEDVPGGTGPAA